MEDELVDRGLLEKNYPYYAPPQIVVGVIRSTTRSSRSTLLYVFHVPRTCTDR